VIIFNYSIFSNYYWCQCVMSDVCVSVSSLLKKLKLFDVSIYNSTARRN